MPDETNLWPEFTAEKISSPKALMQEQALFLGERTKNILRAEISSDSPNPGIIRHFFEIVAPSLKFRHSLFYIEHRMIYYPFSLKWRSGNYSIPDERAFITKMKDIFNDTTTIKIITSLLSQSIE